MPALPNNQPFDISQFKFYSWGLVANNKAQSETTIQVTPIEQLTHLDGELGSIPTDLEAQGKDAQGNAYTTKVTADTAIEADWFPGFGVSNRRTAPDVRRGMRVMIFSYGDTDKYFWCYMGLDDHLFKLETMIHTWSGTTDEAKDSTDPENCYSLEVSTHTGQVTLKTSKANKEYCIYAIQIDAKNGKVQIVDDLDNEFVFDSKNTHLWMKNAEGTLIELDKKILHAFAPDAINMEATDSMLFQTKDYKVITDTYRLECTTGSVKGKMTFEDEVTFNKDVTMDQKLDTTGKITTQGGLDSPVVPIHGPSDTLN